MLNLNNERELAYVVTIDEIEPIEGADRVEVAVVGGWRVMVRKGQFKVGDPAIYFEIDSKVPETDAFEFLASKHYKIKTQKYFKGTVISQGLLMAAEDLGWTAESPLVGVPYIVDDENKPHIPENKHNMFLTQKLGVTYAVSEDNVRKGKGADKYQKMAQRMGKKFSKQPYRWLMKHTFGKKLLYVFYGKKKDGRGWPVWVKKTDEERIENLPFMFKDKSPFVATEKIDGTSTTFSLYKKRFGYDYYVCSRNVVFTEDKQDNCYYDTNVYLEMSKKYFVEEVLQRMLTEQFPKAKWITIQGETYGDGIQKKDYDMKNGQHDFMAFNLVVDGYGRFGTIEMKEILSNYGIPTVPIIDDNYILPDNIDELRAFVNSEPSKVDGKIKEGIVFRSLDGQKSFKCVSPEFLLKYHS